MAGKGENIRKIKDGRWEGRYKNGTKDDGTTLNTYVHPSMDTMRVQIEKLQTVCVH